MTHRAAMIYSTGTSEEKATFLPVLRGYSWPEVLNDPHGLRQIRIHLAVIKTKSQLPVIGLLGVLRKTGAVLCRIALWDYFGARFLTQSLAQLCNSNKIRDSDLKTVP